VFSPLALESGGKAVARLRRKDRKFMDYGIELLPGDVRLLTVTNAGAHGSIGKIGRGGIQYFEFGTDSVTVWNDWRNALDSAVRPYKYIAGANAPAVPVNSPLW
jgi:hypothetical protein